MDFRLEDEIEGLSILLKNSNAPGDESQDETGEILSTLLDKISRLPYVQFKFAYEKHRNGGGMIPERILSMLDAYADREISHTQITMDLQRELQHYQELTETTR